MLRKAILVAASLLIFAATPSAFSATAPLPGVIQLAAGPDEGHRPENTKLKQHPRPDCPGLSGSELESCMKRVHAPEMNSKVQGEPKNLRAMSEHARPDCPGQVGAAKDKCMAETHGAMMNKTPSAEGMPKK